MAIDIVIAGVGQTSRHQPAVVYDEVTGMFHMVFSANDDSNRIFYATTQFYEDLWNLGPEPGQSTGAAPALALYQTPPELANISLLVLVFVANDPSNRILFSVLDLNEDTPLQAWRFRGEVRPPESAQAVSVTVSTDTQDNAYPVVNIYFTSNDPSNRLLLTQLPFAQIFPG
jgi:hypothetical protein